ncbi:MAG: Wzz/FepE/Etk N-terminal domain-containing protein [Aromatoleum sp.]|jgi:uncharacterized protein involved in exopolysaccharide biosynthesis|uniref:Wzz/FepE/Etk N-terminal domain-containing protein n=1 Tax=Aromatoleum sp. TaxID=2307007 RepID=UPI0028955BB6|nr:Wzz/FepE/Etk N-terminal domain-containing protein [Aromatoleum sp.]MDT3671437.1 Wzz/FepE/Etk N-terminal domain-containing protein [Aromatoleum sp.]
MNHPSNSALRADQPSVIDNDEISLLELWVILVRRKLWVLSALAICMGGAVGYLLVKTPVYEARIKLRIGQVAGAGLFELPEVLSSRLLAMHGEDAADGVKRERPFLKQASVPKSIPATVELVAEADSPADAVALLARVFTEVQKTHDQTFRANLRLMNERIQNLDAQRVALQQQFDDASGLIEQLKPRDPVQASLIMLERGRISVSMNDLDAEKPALAQKLTPPQTQSTELLGEVVAPEKAAAPKRVLVLTLALVLGLIGGVLLAFIVEFLSKARERRGSPIDCATDSSARRDA